MTSTVTSEHSVTELRRRIDALDRDLRVREAIGQAKGVLISHFSLSDPQASALLMDIADETGLRLDLLATEIVARARRHHGHQVDRVRLLTETLDELVDDTRRASGLTSRLDMDALLVRAADATP